MTTEPNSREALEPCPWCGETEHLTLSMCGSLTGDMPDRPYRVVCDHLDHDQIQGPVAYGRFSAIAAWNRRVRPTSAAGDAIAQGEIVLEIVELARRDIARTHTDFIGRMGQALCQYESIFDEHPGDVLPKDAREEAEDNIAALAGLALAQLAMLRGPNDALAHLSALPALQVPQGGGECLLHVFVERLGALFPEWEADQRLAISAELARAALGALPAPSSDAHTLANGGERIDLSNAPVGAMGEVLGADVIRLVIAARLVAWEDPDADALKELQQASEAFASRVPWDDEPEDEQ